MTDRPTPVTDTTRNDAPAGTGVDPSHRWRRPLTAFLAVVAALSLVLAMTATWMNSIPGLTLWWFLTIVVVLAAYETSWIYVEDIDDADESMASLTAPG